MLVIKWSEKALSAGFSFFGLNRNKNNHIHAEFRLKTEREMSKNDLDSARMVGDFFQIDRTFIDDLYRVGFRDEDGNAYEFTHAAVFVADIKPATLEQKLEEGRSVAFVSVQTTDGNVRLLGVYNFGRSQCLENINSFAARKAANFFRNMLSRSPHTTVVALQFENKYTAEPPPLIQKPPRITAQAG